MVESSIYAFKQQQIDELFGRFNDLRIMIVGDVMLDSYIFGNVDRISPEAPVPVVAVRSRSTRLGGAANVALNIHALGAVPVLISVVGDDQRGKEFLQILEETNMPGNGIYISNKRITTTKFRIIGNNVQMLRVDDEMTDDISLEEENILLNSVQSILNQERIDAIVFQDYDKGVLTAKLIETIIAMAFERNIPVAVDPKKKNFMSYRKVQLFKPNLKELRDGLNLQFNPHSISEIIETVNRLQTLLETSIVMTTLSDKGVVVSEKTKEGHYKSTHIAAHLRTIADVSGAGDSVISVAALCLALKVDAGLMAIMSNLAGGLVCEEIGVVPVNKNKLRDELLKLV